MLQYFPDYLKEFYPVDATLKLTLLHHGSLRDPRLPIPLFGADNTILKWEKSHRFNVQIQQLTINQKKQLLDKWKSSLTDSHRFIILKNSQTPAAILAKVSCSTSWLERYAIAQNPKTPFPIIKNLAEDGNRLVRAAAKARLETKQSTSLLSSSTTSASSDSLRH